MTVVMVRADASRTAGSGHVMRCVALAAAVREAGGRVVFCTDTSVDWVQTRIQATSDDIVPATADGKHTAAVAEDVGADWLVIDGYQFDDQFRAEAATGSVRVLCIDDHAEGTFDATVVVNGNLYATESMYDGTGANRILAGPEYALIRPEFAVPPQKTMAATPRTLVTMGGTDPDNVMILILRSLARCAPEVGDLRCIAPAEQADEVRRTCVEMGLTATVLSDVSDMAVQMVWADRCISAAGTTVLELCCTGVPMAVTVVADNQIPVAAAVEQQQVGISLGDVRGRDEDAVGTLLSGWLRDPNLQQAQGARGANLVDGRGAHRVAAVLGGEAR